MPRRFGRLPPLASPLCHAADLEAHMLLHDERSDGFFRRPVSFESRWFRVSAEKNSLLRSTTLSKTLSAQNTVGVRSAGAKDTPVLAVLVHGLQIKLGGNNGLAAAISLGYLGAQAVSDERRAVEIHLG